MSDSKEQRKWGYLSPAQIVQDPSRFQSRAEYPIDTMPYDLGDVDEYDEDSAGMLSVWWDNHAEAWYVIDGHRRLELALRTGVSQVLVQYLKASTDAEAFAKGVILNLAKWSFEREDKMLPAIGSRRAAVERALHTRWLNPDSAAAIELYKYYPDLGRRYSSFPKDYE